jgi:hypothetical protein
VSGATRIGSRPAELCLDEGIDVRRAVGDLAPDFHEARAFALPSPFAERGGGDAKDFRHAGRGVKLIVHFLSPADVPPAAAVPHSISTGNPKTGN